MRRLMHLPPRFHVHPALGLLDCLVFAASAVALTPLQRVNVVVDDLTSFFIKAAACVAALTIVRVRIKESNRRAREEDALVTGRIADNTAEIARVRADAAAEIDALKAAAAAAREAARLANEKAADAHHAAHRVAAESEAKIAAAVVAAKAAADAEVGRLNDELRQVRHMTRDVANEVKIDREVRARAVTPDPDRSGPLTVIVANDPAHPVPITATNPPEAAPGA